MTSKVGWETFTSIQPKGLRPGRQLAAARQRVGSGPAHAVEDNNETLHCVDIQMAVVGSFGQWPGEKCPTCVRLAGETQTKPS